METVKLNDICEILNGFAFKSSEYVNDGIRIIRITNVQKGKIEDDDPKFYPLERKKELCNYILREGDILLSLTGNVGRVGLLGAEMLPAALNQRVACLRIKNDDFLKKYVYYNLLSNRFEKDCVSSAKGIAQKNMSTEWLKAYPIRRYSLEKQRKIVDSLDYLTMIVSEKRDQLNRLDDLVKAQFVEMFGDPKSNSKKWKEQKLSGLLSVLDGFAFKSKEFDGESGIPVLRIGNINSGYFKPVNMVFCKEDFRFSRYIIYPGDLVMSLTGTVGKDDYGNICILGDEYDRYYLNQRNAKLELRDELDKYYFFQLLRFEDIKKKLTGISRGVRQANISNRDILNLVIPVPSIELQKRFATFFAQVDKSKFACRKALIFYQRIFDKLQLFP